MSARRVLIADDDESVRRLLRVTLSPDCFEIVEARDGEHALGLIDGKVPDLVLLDWKMPGRSGAEVLKELKRRYPDVRVIVLTADRSPRQRTLARSLGAEVFLTKPFSPVQLIETVERLLAERLLH